MDNEIEALYDNLDSVSCAFIPAPISDSEITYMAHGLGGMDKTGIYADEWKNTEPVEGTFSLFVSGRVIAPSLWEGYHVSLTVNELGSGGRSEYEPDGFLGVGSCSKTYIRFKLEVKPQIARDILDQLIRFYMPGRDPERSISCDLVALERGSAKRGRENELIFSIVGIAC